MKWAKTRLNFTCRSKLMFYLRHDIERIKRFASTYLLREWLCWLMRKLTDRRSTKNHEIRFKSSNHNWIYNYVCPNHPQKWWNGLNDLKNLMNFSGKQIIASTTKKKENKLIEFNGAMKIISSLLELWMAQNYFTLARRASSGVSLVDFHLGLFFSRPFGAWFLWTRGNSNVALWRKKIKVCIMT